MPLEKYQSKRYFGRTPEPAGGQAQGRGQLRFVVQKHQASRLHYDFRLEAGGVLKSWAVPKGPSLNPADKHLAMMVEDHPLDYKDFEGVIPKGNYGAGTVMIWDEGTFEALEAKSRPESERAILNGIKKGHITFILNGQKLKNEFALVKIKNAKEENAWLLVKKDDQSASRSDITKKDRSARTGRTMEEISQSANKWLREPQVPDLSDAPKSKMPHLVKPMLAKLVAAPFDREDWWFEIKWDGYRAVAEVDHGQVELYSRNHLSFNAKFPTVATELASLKLQTVLDGEVVVVDESGRPDFQLLQNFLRGAGGRLVYYVFDILYLEGHDLRSLPLWRRRQILQAVLPPELEMVKASDNVYERGTEFFQVAIAKNLEGVIAKDVNSPYREGRRSGEWLKIKAHARQEAIIVGFTEPRGGRKYFGALVLGVYSHGELVYIGHTGSGFSEQFLAELYQKLKSIEQEKSPFKIRPKTNAPVHWVKPKLVCEISFAEWTDEGQMRQPIFVGLREDKAATKVRRELPKTEPVFRETLESPSELIISGRKVRLTHLDKVYWTDEGYTKGDLINYYRQVADYILPYLKDRPESLHRHPNGIKGDSFFQKDMADQAPEWVKTELMHSQSEERDVNYLVCQDEATLVYMANLGCIEINPWLSRLDNLDKPDFCVIDLDPEGIDFKAVVEVAQAVHTLLEQAKIENYCKTSGATGLHIFVPLGAKYSYDQSKQFAQIIATLVNRRLPKITSIERMPAKRQKRVYLDYLQNRVGQTLASVYSVRPRPGAPVSTPLKWEEVNNKLDVTAFNIKTIAPRLKKVGDLWRPVASGDGVNLKQALAQLAKLED